MQCVQVRDHVYVTAAGPPARVYGVHTKSGSRQWEYKLQPSTATLADLAGPLEDIEGRGTVFMAVNQPTSNSSWVQGLGISSGKVAWQSAVLNSTQLAELELRVQENVVLATNAAADGILAFNAQNGTQLWSRAGSFCRTPSPIADVYKGELLLSDSCETLSGLSMVDVVTGKELWSGWSAPSSAQPLGNCSSVNQAAEHIVFGCSCWHGKSARQMQEGSAADGRGPAAVAGSSSSSGNRPAAASTLASAAAAGVSTHSANGVCLYAISGRYGKLRWALPLVGNASFPDGAQQWDMAPLIHANLVVFLATGRVIAVDLLSGKLRWVLSLPKGEVLRPFEQPVVDADSSTLVLAAQVAGSNKTGLSGVSLKEGRLLWHKTVNGTVQRGAGPEDRAQELMVTGGRVYVEACRGSRCCLRALNVTTGKQRWGMCLDAVQGDDATHPHAQFAIWFITLLTIASIALLVLGAGLVYLQRW
jgi:outer membrane protein assembly factor BamB